jgi:sulfatase modifying factor 1
VTDQALAQAEEFRARGDLESAAALLDATAREERARVIEPLRRVLDALAVTEHGIVFRYVPAGRFTMGSVDGDPDEAPLHEVVLPGFWMSDVPLSWSVCARLLGWPEPPARPNEDAIAAVRAALSGRATAGSTFNDLLDFKIRLQYCENDTVRACDWHAHDPAQVWTRDGIAREVFGAPERSSSGPYRYDKKPMVSVEWAFADFIARKISSDTTQYRLPTEAEWERAARGCFASAPYPWGASEPDATKADFERFTEFSILESRTFPPNDYGLFAMAGGVWEWCADDYDAAYYARSPRETPLCRLPDTVVRREHVLRGGSWADCAEAIRTSFRSSSLRGASPNIGFRLVRLPRDSTRLGTGA